MAALANVATQQETSKLHQLMEQEQFGHLQHVTPQAIN